jgi:hypothetical protein
VLIYLRRSDISGALRALIEERGTAWQEYQTRWKLSSPLAQRHGWHGFEGLIDFYTVYRAECDAVFHDVGVPKILIDHNGDRDAIYHRIAKFLDLPAQSQQFTAAFLT